MIANGEALGPDQVSNGNATGTIVYAPGGEPLAGAAIVVTDTSIQGGVKVPPGSGASRLFAHLP